MSFADTVFKKEFLIMIFLIVTVITVLIATFTCLVLPPYHPNLEAIAETSGLANCFEGNQPENYNMPAVYCYHMTPELIDAATNETIQEPQPDRICLLVRIPDTDKYMAKYCSPFIYGKQQEASK